MTIQVKRLSPALGAETIGIYLRGPVDTAPGEAIVGDVPY